MRRAKKHVLGGVFLAVVMAVLGGGWAIGTTRVEVAHAQLRFELYDTLGRPVSSADYIGAPVLIDFGAAWCGGCQQNAATIAGLAEKYGPRGLQVLRSVSGDSDLESLEFQRHYRMALPNLLDPTRQFEKQYNKNGWPFIVLADRTGKIVYKTNHPVSWSKIENLLADLTRDKPEAEAKIVEGIPYMPGTLVRSGELSERALERPGERIRPCHRERFPSIACADGNVYVVFTSNRNGNEDVYVKVFDGKRWSHDFKVATSEADEFDGRLVIDSSGRPCFSWTSNAGGTYNIHVARATAGAVTMEFPPGNIIEYKITLDIGKARQLTDSDDDAMHARLAAGKDGSVWVAYYKWQKRNGLSRDKEVFVRRFDGGTWSDEVQVSPTDVPWYEDHTAPTIAATGNGAVVAWSWDFHQPDGYTKESRNPTIFFRSVGSDLELFDTNAASGTAIDTMPCVAVKGGKLLLAWESISWDRAKRADRKSVHVWDGQTAALSRGLFNVCTPRLALSPTGAISCVWAETKSGLEWRLMRADFDERGASSGSPTTIVTEGNPRFPAISYDADGTLWVAYGKETYAERSPFFKTGREIVVESFPACEVAEGETR